MGMDPQTSTVDPLNSYGRDLANQMFRTLSTGMNNRTPNSFNSANAPAFEQLFSGGWNPGTGGGTGGLFGPAGGTRQPRTAASGPGGMPPMGGGVSRMGGGADYWNNPSNFSRRGPLGDNPNGGGNPGAVPSSGTRQTGASYNGGNFSMGMRGDAPFQGFGGPGAQPVTMMDNGAGGGQPGNSAMQSPAWDAFRPGGGEQAPVQPFGAGLDAFNMPMWNGPYGAGLTGMQMDAMSGMSQLFGQGNPLVGNDMITGGLAQGMGGNRAFDPAGGQTLNEAVDPYRLPSQATDFFGQLFGEGGFASGGSGEGGGSRLNDVIEQIQPDLVNSFRTALDPGGASTGQGTAAMNGAINLALARANEQASGMGLSPGSIDRASLMAGEAADVAARLGIEQQNADVNAISSRNRDRVGAINSAGSFENILNSDFRNRMAEGQLGVSALPALLAAEERPFERMLGIHEPAAGRSMQTLSMLPEFRNIPFQELGQLFGMGEAARGVADTQVERMLGEYGRTQGGLFDRGVGALSQIPGLNTMVGPSKFSQGATALSGAGQAAASGFGGGG